MTFHDQVAAPSSSDGLPGRPLRVVVAASHAAVRRALRALLSSETGVDVIAITGDDRTAARLVLQHHPDAIVLALPAALHDGGAQIRTLRSLAPDTAVIVVSTASSKVYRSVALTAGATALVALDGPSETLLDTLHANRGHP